jgi:CHAT domain-containing protein/tetratricopeptide (TPR) repeat protein
LADHLGYTLFVSLITLLSFPPTGAARNPLRAAPYQQQKNSVEVRSATLLLELNMPVKRELAGGEVHSYEFSLSSGQYLHAIVDQQGIDAVTTIFGPSGKQLSQVDRPNGVRGPEGISLISEVAGTYRLQVNSLEKMATKGHYTISLVEVRTATPRDESRIAAEKAITEGERLRAQKKAESFLQAIDKFDQALALWRALNERYEEAVALYGIGLAYRFVGENQKAVSYFGQAIPIMRELGDRYGEAVIHTGIAWAYFYLGENERALNSFSHALLLRREINDRRGEALTLHGIGWVYALSGDNQKALDNFFQALSIRRSVSNDRQGEALTLIGVGKVYHRLGKQNEAQENLDKALLLLRETNDHYGEADALSIMGWVYSTFGDYQKALNSFNQALPLRRAAGDRTGEASSLYGIAEVERQRGNLLNASTHMEKSLSIIESLGTKGTSQQLRISYFASIQDYYHSYIELLQDLHQLYPTKGYAAAALQVSERARARSLLDILIEGNVDIRQGVDPLLLEAERTLQQKLNSAAERQRQLVSGKHTDAEVETAAKELESLANDYQEILAQIRAASPRYAALIRPAPLTAPEIQQVLDNDTLLLEYALGKERSYVWAVTPTRITSYQLPARSRIESAAQRVYELMTTRNRRKTGESAEERRVRVLRADAEYSEAAAALGQMLLGPVAPQLTKKRLLIVTQGKLQLVPFAALPVQGIPTGSGKTLTPLILNHEIMYLPSASTLAILRRETDGRKPPPKALAVLADPVFASDDERIGAAALKSGQKEEQQSTALNERALKLNEERTAEGIAGNDTTPHLPRLFATRWEAEEIVSFVPEGMSMQKLDFAANHTTATGCELAQYRIVHFATHALINDTHPELSAIVLSLVDDQGRSQDGYLRAYEIYNLKLPVELVVLSGCRTGLGKDAKGEGLLGLTRGFMYAGARRVMASLWSINDKATAELMVRFYKKMLGPEKQMPTAALRSAQVEMLKDKRWQAPYYWACFVLQGEWR